MRGIGPQFDPVHTATIDVFISYASENEGLAVEFDQMLTAEGMRCFLSKKSIKASDVWRDEIRQALHNSAVVLVLLTPNSIESDWVLIESGAFWAFGKPIFPALLGVNVAAMPDPISQHQGRSIETAADRPALVKEIVAKVRSLRT